MSGEAASSGPADRTLQAGTDDRSVEATAVRRHRDGSAWEAAAGYVRAVRAGAVLRVSGTTAADPQGRARHPGDLRGQTRAALATALEAVTALGGRREDVVRTRIYLVAGTDWREATRVHAEVFGEAPPANTTLYVAGLVHDDLLVEVEVEARVAERP